VSQLETTPQPSVSDYVAPDGPAMRRRVLGLAWPVIAQNLLETLLGIVDTAFVARLGASATAGVGSALQVMFFVLSALSALAIGSSVLVAQAFGAGDLQRASRLARQSLIWSVAIAIPFAVGGLLLARPIMSIFGLQPDVVEIGTDYLHVTMGTVVVLVLLLIGGGVLRGAGDSRTPMVVTAIANVANIALAYGLIYGNFGMPALGAVGSAWATFIARSIALVLMLAALWRGYQGVSIKGSFGWLPDLTLARQVFKIGLPAALEQILTSAAFFVLVMVVARLGTATLAAHQISFTALSASFLPGFGFGIAATTLVGQAVGARRVREGSRAARIATTWALIWMGALGLLLIIFAEPVLRFFTQDEAVIAAGVPGLQVVALTQPFWAILMVLSGALRGTGDTRFPLIAGSSMMWLGVGFAALFLSVFHGGLPMVWAAFLITSPILGALYWWRFRQTVAKIEAAGG
jgi:multidrug resistance protein, MATE family